MNLAATIVLLAGTTGSAPTDTALIDKIKRVVPEDTEWAVQLTMPDDLDYQDAANVEKRIAAAKRDVIRLGSVAPPLVLLNHEVEIDKKPILLQARDYKIVAAAARAKFGDRVMGAFQLPRVPKGGGLTQHAAEEVKALVDAELPWFCFSTYRKDGVWRDLRDGVTLGRLLRREIVPYVSAQEDGDGALIAAKHMWNLRMTLDAFNIRRRIVWANLSGQDLAVRSVDLCMRVFCPPS